MNETSYAVGPAIAGDLRKYQRTALLVGIIGIIACAAGFFLEREQFFRSYLVGFFFWTGVALGCLALVMVQHLTGGAWGVVIRKPAESASRTLPLMALLLIPLLLGVQVIYKWAQPGAGKDPVIHAKAPYLNVPFWAGRAVLYFAIWCGLMWILNKWSAAQDRTGDPQWAKKMEALSGPGLLIYVFTITLASVDWIMSLDPNWFSTVFGFMMIVGQGLTAFAFIIAILVLLHKAPPFSTVITQRHLHDLGKLMLAFVMLWAYLNFAQLIIIWAGNLPEEITWYVRRLNGGWQWVGLVLLLFHFVIPFLMLLSQSFKKNPRTIYKIAIWVILIHMVDVFWLVEPNFDQKAFRVSWLDFAALIGIGGLWVAYFLFQLPKHPLLPVNAPNLQGALEHGRHH